MFQKPRIFHHWCVIDVLAEGFPVGISPRCLAWEPKWWTIPSDRRLWWQSFSRFKTVWQTYGRTNRQQPGSTTMAHSSIAQRRAVKIISIDFRLKKSQFLSARRYARAVFDVIVCLSSVRPSVTSRSSTKTAKRRITQTTPHDSPENLGLWCKRSLQNSDGITPNEDAKCRRGR